MGFNVFSEVQKAIERLPDGAAVTLEAIYETLVRLPHLRDHEFTGLELRKRTQIALNDLREDDVIHLEHVASENGPAIYRKGVADFAVSTESKNQATERQALPENITKSITETKEKKMSKFNFSVGAEVRRVVEGLSEGAEVDLSRICEALIAAHGAPGDLPLFRIYIGQALKPLKGKLLLEIAKGAPGKSAVYRKISANGNGKPARAKLGKNGGVVKMAAAPTPPPTGFERG